MGNSQIGIGSDETRYDEIRILKKGEDFNTKEEFFNLVDQLPDNIKKVGWVDGTLTNKHFKQEASELLNQCDACQLFENVYSTELGRIGQEKGHSLAFKIVNKQPQVKYFKGSWACKREHAQFIFKIEDILREPHNEYERQFKLKAKIGCVHGSILGEQKLYIPKKPKKTASIKNMAIVSCHFNPCNYKLPVLNCREYLHTIGYPVTLVELSFNGKFEFDSTIKINGDINKNLMWQKERLINVGIDYVRNTGLYDSVAWIDADTIFINNDWYNETLEKLCEYPVVQLYQSLNYLNYSGEVERRVNSWAFNNSIGNHERYGAPGLAWAARLDAIPNGIYDKDIIGGGDSKLLSGWLANSQYVNKRYLALKKCTHDFSEWKEANYKYVKEQIGCVSGQCYHLFHGTRGNRKYDDRLEILFKNNFSVDDIRVGDNGAWEWCTNKPEMHKQISDYFLSRKEDKP